MISFKNSVTLFKLRLGCFLTLYIILTHLSLPRKGGGVYSKFKTPVFGESGVDKVQRLKYYFQATSDYDLIRVNNYYSNSLTNLGIGVSAPYTPTAIPWGGGYYTSY